MPNKHVIYSLIFGLLILSAYPAVAQQQDLIINRSVDLRNGPGSYYELLLRLKPGAVVQKLTDEAGWLKVALNNYDGWMPDHPVYYGTNMTETLPKDSDEALKTRMTDLFKEFSGDNASSDSPYVSSAQVAAAVKGFTRKYKTKRQPQSQVDFSRSFDHRIDAQEYLRFRKSRISDYHWSITRNRFPIFRDTIPVLTPAVERIGWAIAGVIAENGLVDDYELQKYLNYVALIVAESSHRPEIPVQIHILDSDDVIGYSTPNGIIFVSKGAIRLMKSEAEFAFFVGHELAHIVLQHGIKETRGRRVRINSNRTFKELEEELRYKERPDDTYIRINQELTEWADQVYEYIIKDKLDSHEHQADFWGMAYAYRAGYTPQASVDFLKRFKQDVDDFNTQIGELIWQGTALDKRIRHCIQTQESMRAHSQLDYDHREEYQQMKRKL